MEEWAKQGVLLLNTCLTVEKGEPRAHVGQGWEELTGAAIRALYRKKTVVFFLWGKDAKEFKKFIVNPEHLVIECEHPAAGLYSEIKRPWVHNNCFVKCNEYLLANGLQPINWQKVNETPPF